MADFSLRRQFTCHNPINPLERAAIDAEIERLIDLLDTVDGDFDLEDDDPAGEMATEDEGGIILRWPAPSVLPFVPLYGEDQDSEPLHYAQLNGWHQAIDAEMPDQAARLLAKVPIEAKRIAGPRLARKEAAQ